jgi:hypothetical protein
MLTQEEKDEIINAAVEKAMLMLPDVIGNLIVNHVALHKLNKKFYETYPEFRDKKDVVQSVVEMVEGKNPLLDYSEILEIAVPEIRSRMGLTKGLNVVKAEVEIKRDFSKVDLSGNGEI